MAADNLVKQCDVLTLDRRASPECWNEIEVLAAQRWEVSFTDERKTLQRNKGTQCFLLCPKHTTPTSVSKTDTDQCGSLL